MNVPITRENYYQRVSQKILDQLSTMTEEEKEAFITKDLEVRRIKRERQRNKRRMEHQKFYNSMKVNNEEKKQEKVVENKPNLKFEINIPNSSFTVDSDPELMRKNNEISKQSENINIQTNLPQTNTNNANNNVNSTQQISSTDNMNQQNINANQNNNTSGNQGETEHHTGFKTPKKWFMPGVDEKCENISQAKENSNTIGSPTTESINPDNNNYSVQPENQNRVNSNASYNANNSQRNYQDNRGSNYKNSFDYNSNRQRDDYRRYPNNNYHNNNYNNNNYHNNSHNYNSNNYNSNNQYSARGQRQRGRGGKRGGRGDNSFVWKRDPSPPPRFETDDRRVRYFKNGDLDPPLPPPVKRVHAPIKLEGEKLERFKQIDQEYENIGKIEKPSKNELDTRVLFYENSIKKLTEQAKGAEEKMNKLRQDESNKSHRVHNLKLNHRNANIAISTLHHKVEDTRKKLEEINQQITQLKAEHLRMEREFGISSIQQCEMQIEKLSNKTEVETTSRFEVKKRVGKMNRMAIEINGKYAVMGRNEKEQNALFEQKEELRNTLNQLRDEKSLMVEKRDSYEKQLNDELNKSVNYGEEMSKLKQTIENSRKEINEKNATVIRIIKGFFQEADAYRERNQKAKEIEERKAELLKQES